MKVFVMKLPRKTKLLKFLTAEQPHIHYPAANKFHCNQCEMMFSKNEDLIHHKMNAHAARRTFPCSKCQRVFENSQDVLDHDISAHQPAAMISNVNDPMEKMMALQMKMMQQQQEGLLKQ